MSWDWIRSLPQHTSPARVMQYGARSIGMIGVPVMLYEAAKAQRGEKVGYMSAAGAGVSVFPAATTAAALMCSFIPGVGPVTRLAAPFVAAILAHTPAAALEKLVRKGVRTFNQWERATRRLECGGDYVDTETAQNYRLTAVRDMNAALVPARRVLGQEALLMHR